MSEDKWNDPEVQALAAEQVSQALHRNLARRVTIVYPTLYPSWAAYMKAFTRLGGLWPACQVATIAVPFYHWHGARELLLQEASLKRRRTMCLATHL